MYYFGYCTWLSSPELRKYMPEAQSVTQAEARNHKVEFRAASGRSDRGWCHLSNGQDAFGSSVIGLVLECDDRRATEEFDDFDIIYLTVHGVDGIAYDCFTYVLTEPGEPMRPPNYYWQHIPDGMREQGFPPEYIQEVTAIYQAATECPDAARPAPSGQPGRDAATR